MYQQIIFSPIDDYGFEWTPDDWYAWDSKAAHKAALRARNAESKRLRKSGYKVRCFSLPSQLLSKGGIGSGKPHIELIANCYGLNYS